MAKVQVSFGKPSKVASKFVSARANHGESAEKLKRAGVVNPVVSINTERAFTEALTNVQTWIRDAHKTGGIPEGFPVSLATLTRNSAEQFLEERKEQGCGQKTLDRDRHALEFAIQEKLDVVKSVQGSKGELASLPRAYTFEQMKAIASVQSEKNALMTEIAYYAGLRAHEGFTIRPEFMVRQFNDRNWSEHMFKGRERGVFYIVKGKGGLQRRVMLPKDLAVRLQDLAFDRPRVVFDRERGIIYKDVHYDLGAGKNWSRSFARAAQKVLGWSRGAHGLRHSYVQNRMSELDAVRVSHRESLRAVANEVGHFSEKTTYTYLR